MKSLFGLLCVIILLYGLSLILFPKEKSPEVYEIEKDIPEAFLETLPDKNELLSPEIEEGVVSREDVFPEENEIKEGEGGILSGAKDYLLSAMKNYEEIFKSNESSRGNESGKQDYYMSGDEGIVEKNNVVAISIYEDILGLSAVREVSDE
ncbi:hypothetical protein MYX76_09560 [Desulfobacterota bacterium AH_259_B03_O07]|nr:hypothetical protein [Desulfobacterota bacterium AH_259_B03_O07]